MNNNETRAQHAASTLRRYLDLKDSDGDLLDTYSQEQVEEVITDLMTDLHHWHQEQFGKPAPDRYGASIMHFEEEREEDE